MKKNYLQIKLNNWTFISKNYRYLYKITRIIQKHVFNAVLIPILNQ